jgi:hypothetical protein
LRNTANVFITQGGKQEIKIEAEENIIPMVRTEVKDGRLIIESEMNIESGHAINLYITVDDLCQLENSGSGIIRTTNTI